MYRKSIFTRKTGNLEKKKKKNIVDALWHPPHTHTHTHTSSLAVFRFVNKNRHTEASKLWQSRSRAIFQRDFEKPIKIMSH